MLYTPYFLRYSRVNCLLAPSVAFLSWANIVPTLCSRWSAMIPKTVRPEHTDYWPPGGQNVH